MQDGVQEMNSGYATELGERIRELRLRYNLSQAELSRRCKVDQGALCRIESGITTPSYKTLESIAEALDISIGNLFCDNLDVPLSRMALVKQLEDFKLIQQQLISATDSMLLAMRKSG